MTLKTALLSLSIFIAFGLTAFSQENRQAEIIVQEMLDTYSKLDSISFSCRFSHQKLDTEGNWSTINTSTNKYTAIQDTNKQWHPAIYLSRKPDRLTEFYRFRDAIMRSKWALENHKVKIFSSCDESPVFVIQYWDVPFSISGGKRDSTLRQSIYIDTLTHLIRSIQTVVSFNEAEIALFSLTIDSIYTHKKNHKNKVFQLNRGMLKAGDKAPDFSLKDVNGNSVQLSDFKGKVILLDFWYIACKPCIKASYKLNELQKEFSDRDLIILGMNTMDKADKIIKHSKKHDISYQSILCDRETKAKYKIKSYPSFYLIDPSGTIVYSTMGYSKDLKEELKLVILQSISNR